MSDQQFSEAEGAKLRGLATDIAEAVHENPRGELEAKLRKESADGALVQMQNGDVVYVPVVLYGTEFYTAPKAAIAVRMKRKSQFSPQLESILDELDALPAGDVFQRAMYLGLDKVAILLLALLRENYPELTAEQMNDWIGSLSDPDNRVPWAVLAGASAYKKKENS